MTGPGSCQVCGAPTRPAGRKLSAFSQREYQLASCAECGFSFVVDPRVDFENLYDARYYAGSGADPDTNYNWSIADPRSSQRYEWAGVVEIVSGLTPIEPTSRWLDFGCGLGGLVRFGRARGLDVVGYDEGYSADRMRLDGLPILERSELESRTGYFDVVTAIEVLEHTIEPTEVLSLIAALLKPGGVFYFTTGNAEPFRGRLAEWRYVNPDVHVSFFEPRTLERALRDAGLKPEYPGYVPGYTSLIRAKVLRTIGIKRSNVVERLVPWSLLSRAADRRYAVSAHPVGRKPPS